MVREMQRNRQLHYTPIGFVDDDPRKQNDRIHGVRVLGTTDELPHLLRDNKPGRGADRDPVGAGRACASRSSRPAARENVPGEDAAGPARADRRRPQPRRPDPAGAGRGRARPRAGRGRPGKPSPRTSRARRCSSPAPAARSARSSAASSRGSARRGWCSSTRASRRCSRSSASSSTSATSPPRSRCSPTAATGAKMRAGLRALPPAGRLPRRGVQARRHARGEPAPGGVEQRARDAHARRGRRSSSASSASC